MHLLFHVFFSNDNGGLLRKKLIQKSLEKRREVPSSKSDEGELEEMPAVSSSETSLVFFKST